MKQTFCAWAVLKRSENKLDGKREHYAFLTGFPLFFPTRARARKYIEQNYSYYRRPDLRAEPHGWKMPRAVRVRVTIEGEGR